MKPSEVLIAAKALIDTPEKWTQGKYAIDAQGIDCNPTSSMAVCRCSQGALLAVFEGYSRIQLTITSVGRYLGRAVDDDGDYIGFQDTHTHPEVMAMWDRAIELAIEDEKWTTYSDR